MTSYEAPPDARLRWRLDQQPFAKIERERVADDDDLFHFLACASFVEITSDIYTHSLIEYFSGDEEVTSWLQHEWEPQEVQHGAALRRYVQAVWPEFDWEGAYLDFRQAYAPLCDPGLLGPTRGLELAARCVVETGTATVYTMVHDLTDEPMLRQLTSLIRTDEVGHYGHFFRHFKRYREIEGLGRRQIFRALKGRVSEIGDEDGWYSFRSVYRSTTPETDPAQAYRRYRRRANERMRTHYPYHMAATMLLRPLDLNRLLQRLAVPALAAGAKRLYPVLSR